jgi:ABC-type multidrug transport system fused ATPase/permease subunit
MMHNFIKNFNHIFLRREKIFFFLIFIGIFLVTGLDVISFTVIIPIFNFIFLDKNIEFGFININNFNNNINLKIAFLIIFLFVFISKNFFIIIYNYFFINFIKKINSRITHDLFNKFLNQEYIFFLKKNSENFIQKVTNDISSLNTVMISAINFLIEIVFVFGISILLIIINYKIFFFLFIIFSISAFLYIKNFKKKLDQWGNDYRDSTGNINNLIISAIEGFKDIIIYNLRPNFFAKFNYNVDKNYHSLSRINFLNNVQKYWLEAVAITAMTLALFYFIIYQNSIISLISIFALFVLATFRLLISINRSILYWQTIKFHYPSFLSLSKSLREFDNNIQPMTNQNLKFKNFIEFTDVSFSYSNAKNNKILHKVNLKINKGECIGIFGVNGSGKTTFLNLLSGFIKPSTGSIKFDNKYEIYDNRDQWIKNISYVQQKIFLIDSTIKNNIILTDTKNFDRNKYNKILDLLNLKFYFRELKNDLDFEVGNNGINLSGGQKQLIALARALYKDAEIIVFDEPTAAFDSSKVELFKDILQNLYKKKTIFMVTHNTNYFLNTFDKIFEFKSGNINSKSTDNYLIN